MTITLRHRILLTLMPLFLLFVGLGGAGVALLAQLSAHIESILRDNYDSVRYMERLTEAVERIDSSFQFALAGRDDRARAAYAANWPRFEEPLRLERGNITIFPDEQRLVAQLDELAKRYRAAGDRFNARPPGDAARSTDYFGAGDDPGLFGLFEQIKSAASDISRLNHEAMVRTRDNAQQTATRSIVGFAVGLAVAVGLGGLFALQFQRGVLAPIRELTDAVTAVGAGRTERRVPQFGTDEFGELARAFNAMTEQLRRYERARTDKLLRLQSASQATIDSFPDPIIVMDLTGRVELANPAAGRLFGVRPTDGDAAPWLPPEPLRAMVAAAQPGGAPTVADSFAQAIFFRLDGAERAYLPQVRPIEDRYGGMRGVAVVLSDVTRFRLLDEAKSNLVATVSHELKTPLTSLRLALHILLEEAVGPLEPKQAELLIDARDNAERLLATIERLLSLAKLEERSTPLELAAIAPADLLRDAERAAAPRASDKDIRLSVTAPEDLPAVAADRERLGHAFANLLDNALAYTDRGGSIALAAAADNETVRFTVTDTGVGIPPADLPHVFERFFRIEGDGRPAGTGLGLAIVREIVLAHGGSVACQSRLGEGTTFTLTLPVAEDAR